MRIRIHKRAIEDVALLVEWRFWEPFWLTSTFAPVDRTKLAHAYSERWFDKKTSPWSFILGEVEFRKNALSAWEIQFCNGRHRTNLLIKHQHIIPVCVIGEIPEDANIQSGIFKKLNEGDIEDIIDFPIYSQSELNMARDNLLSK